jgi:uracil-DNA glycosylase
MTEAKALSFAPDAASQKSAKELAVSAKWVQMGAFDDDEGEVVWGEIKGSSGDVYRTQVLVDEPAFRCSCPSRKRPCKHALALLLLRANEPSAFKSPPPEWAEQSSFAPIVPVASSTNVELEIPTAWADVLGAEISKPYFEKLREFLREERKSKVVYPPPGQEFNALAATKPGDVRVFILGQDPYHGPNQAHGMAFSVVSGVPAPPSLQNIFAELRDDVGCPIPDDGHLMRWAKQGVLLLNAVLTVRRGEANSHKSKGWETFSDACDSRRQRSAGARGFHFVGRLCAEKGKVDRYRSTRNYQIGASVAVVGAHRFLGIEAV